MAANKRLIYVGQTRKVSNFDNFVIHLNKSAFIVINVCIYFMICFAKTFDVRQFIQRHIFGNALNNWVMMMMMLCLLGGLSEEVDEKIIQGAFIPFGEVVDIQIPLDYETGIMHFV